MIPLTAVILQSQHCHDHPHRQWTVPRTVVLTTRHARPCRYSFLVTTRRGTAANNNNNSKALAITKQEAKV
jgi:hypothetical protein